MKKKTRLQGALSDASEMLTTSHGRWTETPREPEVQPRVHAITRHGLITRTHSDPPALEHVYQRLAKRSSLVISPATVMLLSTQHEAIANDAVQYQLAALEACSNESIKTELHAAATTHTSRSSDASAWYHIGKVIGKGAFGRVQLATHRVTNTKVAIKSYYREKNAHVCCAPPTIKPGKRPPPKPSTESDALDWKRVRQEVKVMASLKDHPGIIHFIQSFESLTCLQVVMEHVNGGNLAELLRQSPQQRLTETKARPIFLQLVASVAALHAQNVIHRDLKLENVLLDGGQHPKIIDFGFSQVERPQSTSARSATKNFCGTPSYMAPEVVSCPTYDGKMVDVWSLGVILYLLLCGRFPFQASTLYQLYQNIRASPLIVPNTVSHDAKQLLQRILTVDPLKRLTLAAIQAHPWATKVPSHSVALLREEMFVSFMAWENGVAMVYDTIHRLYGLPVATLRDARRSHPLAALARLILLTAEKDFHAKVTSNPPAITESSHDVVVATKPKKTKPPPAAGQNQHTHKQQLEQLISLVSQSLR